MAIEKTVILNVETKEATKNVDLLSRSFEDAYGEIQPLTGRMGELEDQLYELANAGKQGTDEFKILSAEVGRMKKTIQQTDMQIDSLAKTTSQKLGGSLNFVAGGFSTFQGAMGAVGADSEKLQETMLKVQSAMAITQGIDAMREGYKDIKGLTTDLAKSLAKSAAGQKLLSMAQAAGAATMKVLNFVMKQNPILLLVTAVGALVGAFVLLTRSTDKAALAQKELNRQKELGIRLMKQSQAEIDKVTSKQNKDSQNKIALARAEGASAEQLFQLEKERLEQQIRYRTLMYQSGTKLTAEQFNQQKQDKADLKVLEAQHRTDILNIQKESNSKSSEVNKANREKQKEDAKKQADDLKELQKKAEEDLNEEINAIAEKRLEAQKKAAEDRKAQAAKDEQDIYDNKIGFLEAEIIADENNIRAKKDLLDIQKSLEVQNKELTEGEIAAIDAKYKKQKEDLDIAADAKEKARKQKHRDELFDAAKAGLTAIGDLSVLFAGKSKAQQKKAFQVQKAVNIATATIDTFKGATTAFTSAGNPILGAVFAAAVVAAGLANISKISSTKFDEGAGGGGGGGSTPSVPNVQAANFNVVGAGGANQLAQLSSNPIKAYVVSGEVSSAQSMDRNIVKNATI